MNSKWYYSEFELPIRALLHWYSLFQYMLLIVSIIAQVIIEMCTLWLVGNFSYLAIISSLFVNVSKEVLNAIEYFLSWLFHHILLPFGKLLLNKGSWWLIKENVTFLGALNKRSIILQNLLIQASTVSSFFFFTFHSTSKGYPFAAHSNDTSSPLNATFSMSSFGFASLGATRIFHTGNDPLKHLKCANT